MDDPLKDFEAELNPQSFTESNAPEFDKGKLADNLMRVQSLSDLNFTKMLSEQKDREEEEAQLPDSKGWLQNRCSCQEIMSARMKHKPHNLSSAEGAILWDE